MKATAKLLTIVALACGALAITDAEAQRHGGGGGGARNGGGSWSGGSHSRGATAGGWHGGHRGGSHGGHYGGHYGHGHHYGGRYYYGGYWPYWSWGWYWGVPLYAATYYSWPYYGYYPYDYYPSPAPAYPQEYYYPEGRMAPPPATTEVPRTEGNPTRGPLYMNYCESAKAYFPKVTSCPEGWKFLQPSS